jgi:hypothetical protein
MKKLIFIFLLAGIELLANNSYEIKLYEKILPSIFDKKVLKVFTDNNMKDLLQYSDKFKIVKDCNEADVIIGNQNLSSNCEKPIFSNSYRCFLKCKNSFGAFYWRKGRPQIKFKVKIMKKFNLILPNSFRKYSQ